MSFNLPDHLGAARDFYWKWINALSALITRPQSQERPWRILLLRGGGSLQIIANSGNQTVNLGVIRPADGGTLPAKAAMELRAAVRASSPIVLRLSPEEVVERTVQIPHGARDVIKPVLHNQMNRIVPWALEETCFGFKVVGPNRSSPDQINVRLAATTRSVLDAALTEVRDLGINPTAVDVAATEEMGAGISLQSLAPDPTVRMAHRLHLTLASSLVLCLAVGSAGSYRFWQVENERQELTAKITALRARLAETDTQTSQTALIRDATDILMRRKAAEPPVVSLIEGLSRATPDNTFLTELEVRAGLARMTGKSGDASALIALLENGPYFEHVSFTAPTTREPGETLETFTIKAQVAGAMPAEDSNEPAQ